MYLQRRIAKKFQAVVGGKVEEKVFFGTIDKALYKTTKSKLQKKRLKDAPPDRWRVTFDAMDDEDEDEDDHLDEVLNEDEVHNALELYAKHCKQDPQGIDSKSERLAKEYQHKRYMSTGLSRPRGSILDTSDRNTPVSWPYRSKHKKRPLNKAVVALFVLFVFAAQSISSVANQHETMKQYWTEGESKAIFDQASAARLPPNQTDNNAQRESRNDQQQQSFSACLLWMDDNHRMPEWLAYHYFALPLRHLIIAVDPHSATQVNISSHWYETMDIAIWHDSDYVTGKNISRSPGDTKDQLKGKHRQRQSQFYQACCRHLKQMNRTYTTFHDTDEYLTISEEYYDTKQKSNAAAASPHVSAEFRRQSGHILKLLEAYKQEEDGLDTAAQKDLVRKCIHVPRALYSAVESETEKRDNGVPDWLDANQLDTLRYRHRLTQHKDHDGLGKAIIDVSKLTKDEINAGGNTHRPLKAVCPGDTPWRDYGSLPLGIHHYLGSWESYSFRDDARKGTLRRRDIWKERAESEAGGSDDEIRDWIGGFTEATGQVLAHQLLSGAGLSKSDIDEKVASNHWRSGWE